VHIHATSEYSWRPAGNLNAYCVRCDALHTHERQELRQGAAVMWLPLLSLRAGIRFVCAACGNPRCGDRPENPPDQTAERRLVGLTSRMRAKTATPADRTFVLTQTMMNFWSARYGHQRGLHVTRQSWLPLGGLAVSVAVFVVLASRPGVQPVALQIVSWAAALAATVFLVGWVRCLVGLDRKTVNRELAPLVAKAVDINATLEELTAAHAAMKACGFQFMSLASPRRVWGLMFHDLTKRTAAAVNAKVE
jgi:hypothetical protein